MYKHIFFDLDNTLTSSRSPMEPEMAACLKKLAENNDVIIVSGARQEQIKKQCPINEIEYLLSQNGNIAEMNGKILWENVLSEEQKKGILSHIKKIREKHPVPDTDENDLIQDRKCQISFSMVGHHANQERKDNFDADRSLRKKILDTIPIETETVEAQIGGTTCFDYFQKGKHKGHNVKQLADLMNWNIEECVYMGDAIFPGGNDGSIIGICDYIKVKDPGETLEAIKKILREN